MFLPRKKCTPILLAAALLTLFACRKDSLAGIYQNMPGGWKWVDSSCPCCSTPFNPTTAGYTLRIEMEQEGKYKLFKGNKRIEKGRMQLKNGHFYFICDDFKKKDNLFKDQYISEFSGDSLKITLGTCTENTYYIFLRE